MQVAIEIPLIAVVMVGVSAARGRVTDVFRPDPDWGPGDPDERDEYEQHLLSKRRCKQHPYGPYPAGMVPAGAAGYPPPPAYGYYDNYAMQYYPSYPGGAYM